MKKPLFHIPKTFPERKRATRSRKPSHAPSSISMHSLSPVGLINQSVEDLAKEWLEFNATFTR